MSPENNTRADRHLVLAGGYAEAARRVLAAEIADDVRLPYFALVAHGLELALKAILLREGRDEEDLIWMGHDLAGCRDAVERSRPAFVEAVVPGFTAIVDALSYPHALQCFRYPQRTPRDLTDPARALDALQRLLAAETVEPGG